MHGRVRLQGECFLRDGGKHLDSSAKWLLEMCNLGDVQFELRICRFLVRHRDDGDYLWT